MDKVYLDAKQLTTSVVEIYLKLAELEKQGKKESQEYERLVFLLPKAIEIEKRKYDILTAKEKYIKRNKNVLASAKKIEETLLYPEKDVLITLRTLNYLDKEMYYSLLDSTPNVVPIHYDMEELFLCELVKHRNNLEKADKETIIDYLYAMLASSRTFAIEDLEQISPSFFLSEKDASAMQFSYLPRIEELNDKLFSLKDKDLTKETILLVLYVKAGLHIHPYERNVIEENDNALELIKYFERFSGQKCGKTFTLLSLLTEEERENTQNRI